MHELGIAQEIIAIVAEHAGDARVTRVVLEIGRHALILPDSIRFCFDLCSEGTVAQGAQLEIREIPGRARCRDCGADVTLDQPFGTLRLRQLRPAMAGRRRDQDQGNGDGLMCATCGCSDDSETRLTDLQSRRDDRPGTLCHAMTTPASRPRSWAMPSSSRPLTSRIPRPRPPSRPSRAFARHGHHAGAGGPGQEQHGWRSESAAGWPGRDVLALNLVSSPGAGKTTLLERTIRDLGGELPAVRHRGRPADAQRRPAHPGRGLPGRADQHRDGVPPRRLDDGPGLAAARPARGSVVMIENVGNLVCPALFDLGEWAKVVIVSVTEGDDKPIKYPHMFRASGL